MFEQRFSALNDDDAGGMMKSPSLKRRKSVTTNSSTSVYSYEDIGPSMGSKRKSTGGMGFGSKRPRPGYVHSTFLILSLKVLRQTKALNIALIIALSTHD
eukprot:5156-Heterococcus_DN1.PRE.5